MSRARRMSALLLLAALFIAGCASQQPRERSGDSPAELNARLGLSYMQQGNYDVAREKLERALEQDPDLADAHHYIAELYKNTRNPELAERHYRRALRIAPDDPALQNNFAVFLCDAGRFAEADQRFMAAARTRGYQQAEEAWHNAAMCALRIPDYARAQSHLRAALDIDPLMPAALFRMAEVSEATDQYLQARAFLQRYEAVAPHTPQSLWLGVRIERALGDTDAADAYARRLRSEFPGAEETTRLEKAQ